MSEEEKEAIEEVKRIIEYIEEIYHCDCDREDEEYLKIVLNYIDKLQKENEELKEKLEHKEETIDKIMKELEEFYKKYLDIN